jgi:hypothetical protein
MNGFTSGRFCNTYSMILRHSSFSNLLLVDPLALSSCPLEKAEDGFILLSIVAREWIMHARKVLLVV